MFYPCSFFLLLDHRRAFTELCHIFEVSAEKNVQNLVMPYPNTYMGPKTAYFSGGFTTASQLEVTGAENVQNVYSSNVIADRP